VADYRTVNKALWDDRAPAHAASAQYGVDRFVDDPAHLSHVVAFDRPRLGDLTGLRGVHLQCHIGTDTLSLTRLGATMSGLDFSSASLAEARVLAQRAGAEIDFREAAVYDALDVFDPAGFDLVYTGVGALCWLPSVADWAMVVAGLLKPGGRLFIREGHPMMWALDETTDPATLGYPYFERAEAVVIDEEPNTYVDTDVELTKGLSHSWNHGLAEIITALMAAGLRLTQFVEHDSCPWEALPGQMVVDEAGEWRLRSEPDRLAATYTLQAIKA
jgi:SAM-dependent methyltransferase